MNMNRDIKRDSTTYDLRVTLIGEDPLARAGLAALLAGQEQCAVIDQLESTPAQLNLIEPDAQDVLLWDLGWDAESGLAALADLGEPGAPVLALAPGDDAGEAARAAWQAGAQGVLLRTVNLPMLLAGLRAVAAGLTVWDPALAEQILPDTRDAGDLPVDPLTPRETEVLQLLAQGLPNKEIARRLVVSDHTVKFHVNAILTKFQAQSRTEAVVRATRAGLVVL